MRVHYQPAPGARTTALPCTVHRRHSPASHVNEVHHVWPLGSGGPDIPSNKVIVCATGHNSTHQLLSAWLRTDGDPGWLIRRRYTRGEQALAQLGFERIKRNAM